MKKMAFKLSIRGVNVDIGFFKNFVFRFYGGEAWACGAKWIKEPLRVGKLECKNYTTSSESIPYYTLVKEIKAGRFHG